MLSLMCMHLAPVHAILTLLCVCTAVLIASMSAPVLLLAYCRQHFAQGLVSVLLLNLRANRPAFVLCVDMGKQLIKKRPSSFFPAAKKGKTRFLLKNNLTKTPVSNKALTKKWRETPYVKKSVNFRLDRLKWKRNLKDFIGADEDKMVKILTEDGFLPDWSFLQQGGRLRSALQRPVDATVSMQAQSLPKVHTSPALAPHLHVRHGA